jgi:hypothetical protein
MAPNEINFRVPSTCGVDYFCFSRTAAVWVQIWGLLLFACLHYRKQFERICRRLFQYACVTVRRRTLRCKHKCLYRWHCFPGEPPGQDKFMETICGGRSVLGPRFNGTCLWRELTAGVGQVEVAAFGEGTSILSSFCGRLLLVTFSCNYKIPEVYSGRPITMAARPKAWTIFTRSNAGNLGSNSNQGMYVCVRLLYACVILCVRSGLATGWSPAQGVLPTVYRISGHGPQGCTAIVR